MENANASSSHAVFSIKLHLVLVTKYRRETLTAPLRDYLRTAFGEILAVWQCKLLEFRGEADHVRLLIEIHPALNISVLVNNLKTASARRARNRFVSELAPFYEKPLFWHRAYFVASVGEANPNAVRHYVEAQATGERSRKARKDSML